MRKGKKTGKKKNFKNISAEDLFSVETQLVAQCRLSFLILTINIIYIYLYRFGSLGNWEKKSSPSLGQAPWLKFVEALTPVA